MKKRKQPTDLSYYGLYLQRYLMENHFRQASDMDFIQERAMLAAEVFEHSRREGCSVFGSQELAMQELTRGLHLSPYSMLHTVVEQEFEREIPVPRREAFTARLLPLLDSVFSIYDIGDEDFESGEDYENLYAELTGAVALYIRDYGSI